MWKALDGVGVGLAVRTGVGAEVGVSVGVGGGVGVVVESEVGMGAAVGAGVGAGVAVGTAPPHPSTANTNPTTIRTHKGFITPPYHTLPPTPLL